MAANNLAEYFKQKGKPLLPPSQRVQDPEFQTAMKAAGVTPEAYIAAGLNNGQLNQKILGALNGTGVSSPTGDTKTSSPNAPTTPIPGTAPTATPGLAPSTFEGLLQTMNEKLKLNNGLIDVRTAIMTQLYDRPLTEDEISKLPPEFQHAVRSGDKEEMSMALRIISDQIKGRDNSLDKSVQYLTDGYKTSVTEAQKQKEDHLKNIMDQLKTSGPQAFKDMPVAKKRELEVELGLAPGFLDTKTFAQRTQDRADKRLDDLYGAGSKGGTANEFTMNAEAPTKETGNQVDTTTGLTYNAIYQNALNYMSTGKMPTLGVGSKPKTVAVREAIQNKAAAILDSVGITLPQYQALFAGDKKSVTSNIERLGRIEAVSGSLSAQFPRLAELAQKVGGLGITESDIAAGKAAVTRKFGSVDAGNYIELVQTVRSDYSALQASVAGSRGGIFFAETAAHAIPIGLTPEQYLGLQSTIELSAKKSYEATQKAVTDQFGNLGGTAPANPAAKPDEGGAENDPLGIR